MDNQRFSAIAHSRHGICCPISETRARFVLSLPELPELATVVDFGCGRAEWLRLLATQHAIQGIGIDSNPGMLEAATENCAGHSEISIQGQNAATFQPDSPIDLALCVGSSGVFGGYEGALSAFSTKLQPGSYLLIGEGYWKQEPHDDYLLATGIPREEMGDFPTLITKARDAGFQEMYSIQSSLEEWDEYEGLYLFNVMDYLGRNPGDPSAEAMFSRIDNWRQAYLKWGRDTLGFGLCLFRKF